MVDWFNYEKVQEKDVRVMINMLKIDLLVNGNEDSTEIALLEKLVLLVCVTN